MLSPTQSCLWLRDPLFRKLNSRDSSKVSNKEKKFGGVFTYSIKRGTAKFHFVFVQWRKECTKTFDRKAALLFLLIIQIDVLTFTYCCHRHRGYLRSLVYLFPFNCKVVTFLAWVRRITGWSIIRCGCRRINLDYFQSFNCEVTNVFICIHCVPQFSEPFIFVDHSCKIHDERDYHTAPTEKNKDKE